MKNNSPYPETTTIQYYNSYADEIYSLLSRTKSDGLCEKFLNLLPPKAHILDLGCGTGRDTKYFLEKGYLVTALDASEEAVKKAQQYTGHPIHLMGFREVKWKDTFDGIWAMASLIHTTKKSLPLILKNNLLPALKTDGILYMSFFYGQGEGLINGRYFNDYDEESLRELLSAYKNIKIHSIWQSRKYPPFFSWLKHCYLFLRRKKSMPATRWLHCLVQKC